MSLREGQVVRGSGAHECI